MSWNKSASFVHVQKQQTVTTVSYSTSVLFYFLWKLLSWIALTARCRISINLTVTQTQPLLAIDLYSSLSTQAPHWMAAAEHIHIFLFFVCISSGTVQVRKYSPSFHATFSLVSLLLFGFLYPGEAQLGLQFPLLTVSQNAYCCSRSSKSQGGWASQWAGDVPVYLVWVRLRQWPAQLAEHQVELYLERELKVSMSVSLPIFIRLYQQQLKQAGIYCQIARTNNLISHCLKMVLILAGFVIKFDLEQSHIPHVTWSSIWIPESI